MGFGFNFRQYVFLNKGVDMRKNLNQSWVIIAGVLLLSGVSSVPVFAEPESVAPIIEEE